MSSLDKHLKLAIYCSLALTLLLAFTNPNKVASVLLMLPFLLIFLVIWFGLYAITANWPSATGRARLATLGSALPTLLLVLQSLGQLTLRDTLTVLVLFFVGYFYAVRAFRPRAANNGG